MTTVYTHTESIFNPTTHVDREKFEARLSILGRRIERFIKATLWASADYHDDLDDATQAGFIRLWQVYQREPEIMEGGDMLWLTIAKFAAQTELQRLTRQRSQHDPSSKTRYQRVEFSESSYPPNPDQEEPIFEQAHARRSRGVTRPESDQADKRTDLLWLIRDCLKHTTPDNRKMLEVTIPLVSIGYTLKEIAAEHDIDYDQLKQVWTDFRKQASSYAERKFDLWHLEPRGTTSHRTPLSEEEKALIQEYTKRGLSATEIARQIGCHKITVASNILRENRKGAMNQTLITTDMVAQMKHLRQMGWTQVQIAASLNLGKTTVGNYLRGKEVRAPRTKFLTQPEIDQITRLSMEGKSAPEIAKITGRSKLTVRRYTTRRARESKPITPHKQEQIVQLRKLGASYKRIAELVGCDRKTVAKYLTI